MINIGPCHHIKIIACLYSLFVRLSSTGRFANNRRIWAIKMLIPYDKTDVECRTNCNIMFMLHVRKELNYRYSSWASTKCSLFFIEKVMCSWTYSLLMIAGKIADTSTICFRSPWQQVLSIPLPSIKSCFYVMMVHLSLLEGIL